MPDAVEQIVSRPSLIESRGVVELIDQLYWDETEGCPKKGFVNKRAVDAPAPGYAASVPEPGNLRALESTLGQLQCTHDLRSMTAEQIRERLPAEFAAWAE